MSIFHPGDIRPIDLEQEMRQSYMDYAMSVIISRALPDVRDGLKPVQRRILYAMLREGLTAAAKTKKSAAIVGEVMMQLRIDAGGYVRLRPQQPQF